MENHIHTRSQFSRMLKWFTGRGAEKPHLSVVKSDAVGKKQKCFILVEQKGHPVRRKGMFCVYTSRWRAHAHNLKGKYIVKRLILEL